MSDYKILSERFNAKAPALPFAPRFNARPSQILPVILNASPKQIQMGLWGLKPAWSKNLLINTRKETLETKTTFKNNFQNRRCLILSDGFYEWEKQGQKKIPYRFELKTHGLFAFAGIWDESSDKKTPAFSIITVEPNSLVSKIHNRMPAILPLNREKDWLNPDFEKNDLLKMLTSFPRELMQMRPVSSLVNSAKNDSPLILQTP